MIKNVLIVDNGLEYGGGTKSLLLLLEELSKNENYCIYVFFEYNYQISDNTKINDYLKNLNLEIIENNFKKLKISKFKKEFFRFFSKKLLYKNQFIINSSFAFDVLSSNHFDLIHLNNHFGSNLEYIYAANKLKIPVIQHLRKNSLLNKYQINLLKELKFYTISVSHSTFKFYNNQIPIDKNIVYNPFDFDNEIVNRVSSPIINILMPANYLENKGHIIVFKALNRCNRDDIKLFIAGSGKFNNETEILKNKLINDKKLIELGFVKDLSSYFIQSDYIISFSENEGLPRVVLEGLSYGCNIITSNYDVSFEIKELLNNKDVYTIINRSEDDLFRILQELKKPTNYYIDANISSIFSLENYVNSIENLYNSLI